MGHRWRQFSLVHCQASRSPGPEQERQKRWAELFEQLDLNKDGRVDIVELQAGLSGQGLSKGSAEKVDPKGTEISLPVRSGCCLQWWKLLEPG